MDDAPPVTGVRPDGTPIEVDVGQGRWLVAFLTTGCATCGWWWEHLASPPAGCPPVAAVVTPDPSMESPGAVARAAPAGATVVMAGDVWEGYGVRQSTTFVLVVDGRVTGRVVASSWADVAALPALRSR